MLTLYSKPNCPHCVQAKAYLDRNAIPYQTVDVLADPAALAFIKETKGHRTVPQLYVGDTLVVEGGNSGLQKLTAEEVTRRVALILQG